MLTHMACPPSFLNELEPYLMVGFLWNPLAFGVCVVPVDQVIELMVGDEIVGDGVTGGGQSASPAAGERPPMVRVAGVG